MVRVRPEVTGAKRIVVKVGSSSLTEPAGQPDDGSSDRPGAAHLDPRPGGLDSGRVGALVDALAEVGQRAEVVLVSSGAIAAGLAPLGLPRRPRDLATQQAAASVGQGLLMQAYTNAFGQHGRTVGQVLLTVGDVTRRTQYRNAYRTLR